MEQSVINMQNTKHKLKNLSCTLEMMSAQLAFLSLNMESQINTQTIMEDQDDNPSDDEASKKSLGEDVEEEVIELIGCGIMKIVEGIETSHEVELHQEWSYIEEDNTINIEEVMMAAEEIKGLLDKEVSCEQGVK